MQSPVLAFILWSTSGCPLCLCLFDCTESHRIEAGNARSNFRLGHFGFRWKSAILEPLSRVASILSTCWLEHAAHILGPSVERQIHHMQLQLRNFLNFHWTQPGPGCLYWAPFVMTTVLKLVDTVVAGNQGRVATCSPSESWVYSKAVVVSTSILFKINCIVQACIFSSSLNVLALNPFLFEQFTRMFNNFSMTCLFTDETLARLGNIADLLRILAKLLQIAGSFWLGKPSTNVKSLMMCNPNLMPGLGQ